MSPVPIIGPYVATVNANGDLEKSEARTISAPISLRLRESPTGAFSPGVTVVLHQHQIACVFGQSGIEPRPPSSPYAWHTYAADVDQLIPPDVRAAAERWLDEAMVRYCERVAEAFEARARELREHAGRFPRGGGR